MKCNIPTLTCGLHKPFVCLFVCLCVCLIWTLSTFSYGIHILNYGEKKTCKYLHVVENRICICEMYLGKTMEIGVCIYNHWTSVCFICSSMVYNAGHGHYFKLR